jgi:hypothetical protein
VSGYDLAELRAGATGQPAHPGGELEELRRQQRQVALEDATPLARDAAQAYREVCGTPEQREAQLDSARRQRRQSTFH